MIIGIIILLIIFFFAIHDIHI